MSYQDVEDLVLTNPRVFYQDLDIIDLEQRVGAWSQQDSNVLQSNHH